MYVSSVALILALVATSTLQAQDVHPGVPVGERAPDFTLKDQNDSPVCLSELLKNGNVAVVFHRSADW